MKKDLRSMAGKSRRAPSPSDLPPGVYESFERQKQRFEGKSESELLAELQKYAGSVDPGEIERFRQSAQGLLDPKQQARLNGLLRRLEKP